MLYARYLDAWEWLSDETNRKDWSIGHSFGAISRFAKTATFGCDNLAPLAPQVNVFRLDVFWLDCEIGNKRVTAEHKLKTHYRRIELEL